ncbi:hypothetical protein [Streptomyces daliensis]|uniref:Secreted protein n=1 Tax=Streptomyces daliensis TaxID=299421 RepID=A0A8T4IZR8_9ACTN|nr:hypothetical protein [Streptomyces daliensis]
MRRSRTVVRFLVTAVSLLLSVLISADCAAAQVTPPVERVSVSAERSPTSEGEHTKQSPKDCQMRRGARQPFVAPTPVPQQVVMCGCDSRVNMPEHVVVPVTGSEAVPRARSVEIPLLHQVFRC